MLKNIQLKLLNIKYNGESVGDDIRVEIEALGKFLRIDKRIRVRTAAQVNQTISIFETDQKIFEFNTRVVVIEKDLLFNDVGNGSVDIKVDTAIIKPQKFSCKIEIKETRSIFGKIWGNRVAIFEIMLETQVSEAIMCTPRTKDGWLKVILEKDKTMISLPPFLKIKTDGIIGKRERFVILEGVYRGQAGTVKLLPDGSSQFISIVGYSSMVRAKYSISKKLFELEGAEYKVSDHPNTPWKKGLYDIEIPDAPHKIPKEYLEKAKFARIWFRIGHVGEKYLHTGRVSLGCMTITEIEKWDELCEVLLKARKGDLISIGIVEIVD